MPRNRPLLYVEKGWQVVLHVGQREDLRPDGEDNWNEVMREAGCPEAERVGCKLKTKDNNRTSNEGLSDRPGNMAEPPRQLSPQFPGTAHANRRQARRVQSWPTASDRSKLKPVSCAKGLFVLARHM
jgi:hypothetical protein